MVLSDDSRILGIVSEEFRDLGAALARPDCGDLDPQRVVDFAARGVPHAEHCGLTLLRPRHRPRTLSATGPLPLRVDEIQYAAGQGPCLDASEGEYVALTGALDRDSRWPVFGPRCVEETGVRSMLSVRLPVGGDDQAAMNFYATKEDVFGEFDVQLASVVAPFAALAVEHTLRARDADNFRMALSTSRQIGTAVGIIMARHLVTSSQAFDLLRAASQHLNRKLRDVAAVVEETGALPEEGALREEQLP